MTLLLYFIDAVSDAFETAEFVFEKDSVYAVLVLLLSVYLKHIGMLLDPQI
jgi:hypothetical protein